MSSSIRGSGGPDVLRSMLTTPRFVVGLVLLLPFVLCAIAPGTIAPYGPNELVAAPFEKPGGEYLLGTDDVGRDELSRLVWAARADLKISLASTLLAAVVGIAVGLVVGYRGGLADAATMRATDVMLAFPSILLALFLIAVVGRSDRVIIVALALLFVPGFVRLARALALQIRHRGFVESSELSGGGGLWITWRHLLPNAVGPILVGIALTASYALLAAATLSYLGLGVQLPDPSWGNMLQSSFNWLFQAWWTGIFPGVCIAMVALGYTFLAGGIDDALRRRGSTVDASASTLAADLAVGGREVT